MCFRGKGMLRIFGRRRLSLLEGSFDLIYTDKNEAASVGGLDSYLPRFK
jgi:hypothetical protein